MLSGSLRKPQNVALRNPFPLSGTKKVANRDQPTDFVDYTQAVSIDYPSVVGGILHGKPMESSLEHGLTNDDAPYHQIGEN